jgi:hypothetical protein
VGSEDPGRVRTPGRRHQDRHLTDAVAALDVTLTEDEVAALENPYTPRLPTYF